MNKFVSTTLALSSVLAFPAEVLASSSGTVSASTNVGYSCEVTVPSNQALIVSGTTAAATATLPLSQTGDTDYSLSSLSITSPSASNVSGSIIIRDFTSAILVQNASTSASATGATNLGLSAGDGSVSFLLNEDSASAFAQGSYSISSTLSCSEAG